MMDKRVMDLHLFDEGADGGNKGNGGEGSSGSGNGSQGNAGTYTYEQLDEIAKSRSERAERSAVTNYLRQQGLSEEEAREAFSRYKQEKEKNKPDISAVEKERDDAIRERDQLKNSNILRDKGVKPEDIDYVMFKVGKFVDDKTDFTKAAEKYLKENPRYTGSSYRISTSTGTQTQDAGGNVNDSINNAIRAAARR